MGLGDVGESAPDRWTVGGPNTPPVHLVLNLYTDEHRRPRRQALGAALNAAIAESGAEVVWTADADALPGGRVHFGFRDGISQPRISGAPGRQADDDAPEIPAGDVLLGAGHRNSYGGNHLESVPAWLGDNGTYAAVRVLEQDVEGFERWLDRWTAHGLDREWVAARIVGRWRNGTSLMTSPDSADPLPSDAALNRFDYGPSPEHPLALDDGAGIRCPAGSHVRRCNPRSAPSLGLRGSHRIVRRGMPYGPPYDPGRPFDGRERGLIGLFLCADLELAYEFVLRVWANGDISQPGQRGSRDPLIGAQPPGGGFLRVPLPGRRDDLVLDGVPNFTRTRGSAYCLLPGLRALRTLAAGGP